MFAEYANAHVAVCWWHVWGQSDDIPPSLESRDCHSPWLAFPLLETAQQDYPLQDNGFQPEQNRREQKRIRGTTLIHALHISSCTFGPLLGLADQPSGTDYKRTKISRDLGFLSSEITTANAKETFRDFVSF